ncbi:hypothetical protein HY636_01570 [Candidatus Woesearchaeota archaeon]|nr:hypothetical protein [Candidatus Woesearchaeota archaeon]
MVTINRNYVTAGLLVLGVAAVGFLLKDKISAWYSQKGGEEQEEKDVPRYVGEALQKWLDSDNFQKYKDSEYFPASFAIPKGKPKTIGALVDQCTTSAGVYYGSMGGLPSDFPKQDVAVACSAYLLEELAKAGCSPKKSGAIYCNGNAVKKQSTFEVVVDTSLENHVGSYTNVGGNLK